MRLPGACRFALATLVAAPLVGCGAGNQTADGSVGGGGMPPGDVLPQDLLSDFEEGRALVLPLGRPGRSGFWYAYNDAAATCLQSPAHGDIYYGSTAAPRPPGPSGGRALHASWNGCAGWGAGVGADFNVPVTDGGTSMTVRTPYDLTGFAGVAFWAMAMPGAAPSVRAKLVMRVSTQIQQGGACDESVLGPDQCGDEWGEPFTLPTDGTWKAVTIRFSDPAFRQEPWGQRFAWNPADVFGIQFQSIAAGGLYDFWIDDIYLLR